jgi:hypothetical protein
MPKSHNHYTLAELEAMKPVLNDYAHRLIYRSPVASDSEKIGYLVSDMLQHGHGGESILNHLQGLVGQDEYDEDALNGAIADLMDVLG